MKYGDSPRGLDGSGRNTPTGAGAAGYSQFYELVHRNPAVARALQLLMAAGLLIMCAANVVISIVEFDCMSRSQFMLSVVVSVLLLSSSAWCLLAPFPKRLQALAFVAFADAMVPLTVLSMCDSINRIGPVSLSLPTALFIAFTLGEFAMLCHLLATGTTFAWVVVCWPATGAPSRWESAPLLGAILFVTVAVPAVMQVMVRLGRPEASALTNESRRDPLTNLHNRRAWESLAPRLLRRATTGDRVVVALIDIDRFKTFNDLLGHSFGDSVLRATATKLTAVSPSALVCRYGGDEFVTACRVREDEVEEFVARCAEPAVHQGRRVLVSVGAAHAPVAADIDRLIVALFESADRALLGVKAKGGNGSAVVDYIETGR